MLCTDASSRGLLKMSDVSAVVLTIGEETTQRAIDSLKEQTILPEEIITIKDITPFYKAMNLGASRAKTEFFIQIDSDMILDRNCLEDLRRHITNNMGVVGGQLRDPLVGRVCCVKLFRRECFDSIQFKDSISPDTDFYSDILRCGWKVGVVQRDVDESNSDKFSNTFGDHLPSYTPLYTFSKHLIMGGRYRYRKNLGGFLWYMGRLQNSGHKMALIAQISMAHGIFNEEGRDLLRPYSSNDDLDFLENFLTTTDHYSIGESELLPVYTLNPKQAFNKFYKLGIHLRRANSFSAFRHCMNILNESRDVFAWIAKVGLGHGLFSEDYDEEIFEREYGKLNDLLSESKFPFLLPMRL